MGTELTAAIAATDAAPGGAVQIIGPGGVGKSALAAQLADAYRAAGWQVVHVAGGWDPIGLFAAAFADFDEAEREDIETFGDPYRVGRLAHLLHRARLLLVFDDFHVNLSADGTRTLDPMLEPILIRLCAKPDPGRVVFTSRRPLPTWADCTTVTVAPPTNPIVETAARALESVTGRRANPIAGPPDAVLGQLLERLIPALSPGPRRALLVAAEGAAPVEASDLGSDGDAGVLTSLGLLRSVNGLLTMTPWLRDAVRATPATDRAARREKALALHRRRVYRSTGGSPAFADLIDVAHLLGALERFTELAEFATLWAQRLPSQLAPIQLLGVALDYLPADTRGAAEAETRRHQLWNAFHARATKR